VVGRSLAGAHAVTERLSLRDLEAYTSLAQQVAVDRQVIDYAVSLAEATRFPDRYGLADLAPLVAVGASPRGPIGLTHAARALALLRGRSYTVVEDVSDLARDVLRHRVSLSYEALADGVRPDDVLDQVLAAVARPAARDLHAA
jgi:MoxR-like ATPase